MKELVVLSGKGGTGKTSLTAAFAAVSQNKVLCDADVDAADLHLILDPTVRQQSDFTGGGIAEIDKDRCTQCGQCLELCRFDAISDDYVVSAIDCEGCGVCVDLCPQEAIDFPIQTCGQWFVSDTRCGPLVHARLGIAEENSGKLVALVRQQAKALAEERGASLILTDGPPGVGCPVIASVGGASAVLILTEPTVSGVHDMQRALDLAAHFNVSAMVCINKCDLNADQCAAIETLAQERHIRVVGKIPFDALFTEAMVQGRTVVDFAPQSAIAATVRWIWETIVTSSEMNPDGERNAT